MGIVRRTTEARLVFLGEGEERPKLVALAHQLGINSCVSFLGEVANPLPYMKKAAVLALSSIVEALPTVLIEALAVGLPIVATDCPTGPREILCDGAYGDLVPVSDSAALAAALLRVLGRSQRNPVPEEALVRFQHDHVIGKYLAILGLNGEIQGACLHDGIGATE
jgi:glycosyltransferase involved in cell wall biosynthesis